MKNDKKNYKVTLVGAGPGAVDLITVKGLNAIKTADVIFYDALVNKELLKNAKPDTNLIYVGKRFNNHRFSQTEINTLLAEYAFTKNNVVRLKGGDPFVFGRGSEEVDYLENCGIEVEIIPGISSALAVPTNQGIPLTKRGVNESFWVITGTTSNGEISKDIMHGAKSSATLVILMGLRNFTTILNEVLKYRPINTPFAIIQNGTLQNETICIETLENYKNALPKIDYKSPGIIVIGDVVAEHNTFLEEEIQRVLENY
ncbi:uroporphyrinogen-III C-methyltransferase [uncultured Polaribacter sp.]|uniref:uroporphyrinogen-III C-methyltransferase n=1 Tax=uncultured Polaribacter sp. TaxID=174711 RepID=UPI002627375E|nr:uroporphyrinogen-III C-methyltransferase [uncultured Polaribacter sp.]